MDYDFAVITSVKNDGTEYNILGLLRSLEMIDIGIPIYIACFNHPPAFDLIAELEVCGDLVCDFDRNDTNLGRATVEYLGPIVMKKYKKVLYVDHNLKVYKLPEIPEGITIAQTGNGIENYISSELEMYMRRTIIPGLLTKCEL